MRDGETRKKRAVLQRKRQETAQQRRSNDLS